MTETPVRLLTQSELKLYRRCKRAWWLNQYRRLRLRPQYVKPRATYAGSLVHRAIEVMDGEGDWRRWLSVSRDATHGVYENDSEKLKDALDAHDLAEIMVEGYIDWLERTGADQFYEIISIEEKIQAPLTDSVALLGKLDKRVRDTNTGKEKFIDYKTGGDQIFTLVPRRAPVEEQFLHYTLLLQLSESDADVWSGIWRMMKKSKRTDRTLKEDGSEGKFYDEHEYRYNEQQLRSYELRVLGLADEIAETERRLDANILPHHSIVPPTPTIDCWRECQFAGICPMFDDGSRVEQYIEEWYEQGDPLDRYQQEESEHPDE